MDPEYREFFYTREPLARLIDHGDVSAQLKMKEDMKCKSFDWFMKEIAYDVLEKYPKMPPNKHWGELKNQVSFDLEIVGNRNPYAINYLLGWWKMPGHIRPPPSGESRSLWMSRFRGQPGDLLALE